MVVRVDRVRPALHRVALVLPGRDLEVLIHEVDLLELVQRGFVDDTCAKDLVWLDMDVRNEALLSTCDVRVCPGPRRNATLRMSL